MSDEFKVVAMANEYQHISKSWKNHERFGSVLWYVEGPWSPGPHGFYLSPQLYFASFEEATLALPMIKQAYLAGRANKLREIKNALEISNGI